MSGIEVLKFGSSVLRTARDLPVAGDEIYRRWRAGARVLAVVSAFEGVTDRLMREAAEIFADDCAAATAAYVASGEQQTGALLTGWLNRCGLPARLVDPREIGLSAQGASLDSEPFRLDKAAVAELWSEHPILVLPGFYGIDAAGRISLFGRGGSDLSAVFLAAQLRANCRLLKNVSGVFDADPAEKPSARRYATISWHTAKKVAGPLVQPKALTHAEACAQVCAVGQPNETFNTRVGTAADSLSPTAVPAAQPLRIALFGCGVVGRGVYDGLKHYPGRFEISQVVVREPRKHADLADVTGDSQVALEKSTDIVVVCFGGTAGARTLIEQALAAGKFVVTANKAAVAALGPSLANYARGASRRLWYSAAVGGALPALETLATLRIPVREIRGSVNGTCGVVLDAWAAGHTREQAVALAQARGFAEADPERDLSGRDSADKLALLIEAAFGHWLAPESIATTGIDTLRDDPAGYQLIARARHDASGVRASVAPERLAHASFLGGARGPENRLEIELDDGSVIRLRGQGAGRAPTAISVLGDLHEIARRHV
jgi:homoserine dehydrogenase